MNDVEFRYLHLPIRGRFGAVLLSYALAAVFQALLFKVNDIYWMLVPVFLIFPIWLLRTGSNPKSPRAKKTAGKKAAGKMKPITDKETDRLLKKLKSKVNDEGTWKPVTISEVDRLRAKLKSLSKVKTSGVSYILFGALLTFAFFVFAIIAAIFTGIVGFFLACELYLIFIPFIWLARLGNWYPKIAEKLDVFMPVLNANAPAELQLTPLLLFDGLGGMIENPLPTDIRFMLAPGDGMPQKVRDELLGAQFQLSFNNGPDGRVPYVYAVFITKGMVKIWQTLKDFKSDYIIESGSSAEGGIVYGTVVFRTSGYHTREGDIRNLFSNVANLMKSKW